MLAVVTALVIGSAGPGSVASAQAASPAVRILPTTTNERSDLLSPALPCKPPSFFPGGYTGPCHLVFPVSVDPPSAAPVQVTVTFSFGTASAADVTQLPAPITLTVPASGSACFCVVIADDTVAETDETIVATITAVSGGVAVAQPTAVGTILDDEPPAPAVALTVGTRRATTVELSWTSVAPLRGVLTGYTINATDTMSGELLDVHIVEADIRQLSVDGLTPGRTYEFFIRALTTDGYGVVAGATASTVPGAPAATPPSAPSITTASPGRGFATATWTPSAADNGAPVVAYSLLAIRHTDGSVAGWRNFGPNDRRASITGLANGVAHDLYVLAWNAAGPTASTPVAATPSATGPEPAAPAAVPYIQIQSGLPGGQAIVTWGQGRERGLPVLGYSVILSERINGRPVHLVEWRNLGPLVRSTTFTGLQLCRYDVHVVPYGPTGFGEFAAALDQVIPPAPAGGRIECLNPPD